MRPSGRLAVSLSVVLCLLPGIAAAQSTPNTASVELVSPGGPGSPTLTTECPTFSWAPGESVAVYELAVFELTDDRQPRSVPNLHVALSGRASTWTPPTTKCLVAGHQYGWYMREIKKQSDNPGKWTPALSFTVTKSSPTTSTTTSTSSSGAATTAAQAGGNGGGGNGGGASNQAILDRLTAIETQLNTLLTPGVKKETCVEFGAEGELGIDGEGRMKATVKGAIGALFAGNGAGGEAEVNSGFKVAGGVKGNLAIKRSRCWDPVLGGAQAATANSAAAAAALTDDEFKALIATAVDQLQLTEERIGEALTALPTLGSGTDLWSSLKGDGPLSRLGALLPVPDHVRSLVDDPGQIVQNLKDQLNFCGRTDLPVAIAGMIAEFCDLANNERFSKLLDRVDGAVQLVKGGVDTVKSTVDTVKTNVDGVRGVVNGINTTVNNIRGKVDDVYCFFFCSPLR